MPVTELALLHLSPDTTLENADLRSTLLEAKELMQNYTGYTFYYFEQIEDPSYIYILGAWDSLSQHMHDFIPGAENQAILSSLNDKLTVEWLQHIDVAHADLELPLTAAQQEKAHKGEIVWSIVRHFIKDGMKEQFSETFQAKKGFLEEFVTEGEVGGGWRVDREEGGDGRAKEEFVLFAPWKSVEQHIGFADTERFKEYAGIRVWIGGAEVKHVRLLDI